MHSWRTACRQQRLCYRAVQCLVAGIFTRLQPSQGRRLVQDLFAGDLTTSIWILGIQGTKAPGGPNFPERLSSGRQHNTVQSSRCKDPCSPGFQALDSRVLRP